MPHEIVHFEIPAKDGKKVSEFYATLFNWKIERMPGSDYWMINTEKGAAGGIMTRTMPEQVHMNYISVDDVIEHSKKIEEAGGQIVMPKSPVPGMGWFAVALDPEGNPFGIWEDDENAAPQE